MLLLAAGAAHALPVLEFEFLDSGLTFGPTEPVLMRGRVTNVGDMALTGAVGNGSASIPTAILDQYFDPAHPTPAPAPSGVIELDTGQSVEWIVGSFAPFPVTGNPGDPVPPGLYVFPLANLSTSFFVPAGADSFTIDVLQSHATDFSWTVRDVPEPGLGLLLGWGLLAVGWRRRPALYAVI